MVILRRFVRATMLSLLLALAGCAFMETPSILTSAPPPPPVKEGRHEPSGGFAVLVDAPGQPSVARAVADIGAFAQRRGFVRQGEGRYISGKVMLDVTFRAEDSRVIALLHASGLNQGFVEKFYRDFNREYSRAYGEENPIIENDFVADRPLGL